MWRQGLPPRVRGQVWQLAVGNSLQINMDLFNILLKKKAPEISVNLVFKFIKFFLGKSSKYSRYGGCRSYQSGCREY